MTTDGTLLQGEITDFSKSKLGDQDLVERLLTGFMRALVEEQLVDNRREARSAPALDPLRSVGNPLPSTQTAQTIKPVSATPTSAKRNFKCIQGGREGNA
jgi:hypothetical protein